MNKSNVINAEYKVYTMTEFMKQPLKDVNYLVKPLVPESGISLLYAERGAGKTFMALSLACAAASGFDFLNFQVSKPCEVLYVDAEMDSREIQERLFKLERGFARDGKIVNRDNLRLFLCGMQDGQAMPNLATPEGQAALEREIGDSKLIILDNIFSLYKGAGKENESDTWSEYNSWSVSQRNKGRSILWIHHTGKDKNRGARGSSAIESVLNYSLALTVPDGHKADAGLEVDAEYTKSRGLTGDIVKEFSAKLVSTPDNSSVIWYAADTKEQNEMKIVKDLRIQGATFKQIQAETGISKSKAQRISKKQ